MSIERGPLQTYEVIWRSGHVEKVEAHQVMWPMPGLTAGFFEARDSTRVLFHGEVEGHWCLVLAADEADILSVRLVPTPVVALDAEDQS